MDKKIAVRFYDVSRPSENGPLLREVLQRIFALGTPGAREAILEPNFTVRLERLEVDDNFLTGEFTRVQTTNYPSEVLATGVRALSLRNPLGHGIVFRFRTTDSVLAVQYEPRVLAPSRIYAYLREKRQDAEYKFDPHMRTDAWTRLEQHPLRKLTIGIASPADLSEIEDKGASVSGSFRSMGHAYEAPSIVVELSMGHRKGSLGEATKKMAKEIFDRFQKGEVDLRAMRGIVQTEEGIPNDEINFIDEILSYQDELELPENDPQSSYEKRRDWLRDQLQNNV